MRMMISDNTLSDYSSLLVAAELSVIYFLYLFLLSLAQLVLRPLACVLPAWLEKDLGVFGC